MSRSASSPRPASTPAAAATRDHGRAPSRPRGAVPRGLVAVRRGAGAAAILCLASACSVRSQHDWDWRVRRAAPAPSAEAPGAEGGTPSAPARSSGAGSSAARADTAEIRAAALDYIQGWYAGDAERMARAVHPLLAKRIAIPGPGGRTRVEHTAAETLVAQTREGGGRQAPGPRRADVRVLDVFGDAASVRIDADAWVDYLQLARVAGRWQIVNVLWALRGRGT